jgi:hypothetical protein
MLPYKSFSPYIVQFPPKAPRLWHPDTSVVMDHTLHSERLQGYSTFFPEEAISLFGESNFNYEISDISFLDIEGLSSEAYRRTCLYPDIDFFGSLVAENQRDVTDIFSSTMSSYAEPDAPQATPSNLISGPQVTCPTECPRKRNSRKRARDSCCDDIEPEMARVLDWENSVSIFPVQSESNIALRKRKKFSNSRRKEVALNRLVGACIH